MLTYVSSEERRLDPGIESGFLPNGGVLGTNGIARWQRTVNHADAGREEGARAVPPQDLAEKEGK
jgi:hypothetical protein